MGYRSNKVTTLSRVGQVTAKALFQATADLVRYAAIKAPVDTGQLRQSGKVVVLGTTRFAAQFSRASAKGYNVAARMEFDKSLRHPKGGQAGYLSESAKIVREDISNYIKRFSVK